VLVQLPYTFSSS